MKHKNLLILALSAAMLASCGGNSSSAAGASSANPGPSTSQSADGSSSSRTRTRSSDSDASSVSKPTAASLPDTLPEIAGTNIAYVGGLESGGESAAKANPGNLYEWHGDGGNVLSFTYGNGEYSINYTPGWAWYGCQIFYAAPYAQANDVYTIRLCIYSDVAGTIRVNGNNVDLVWGWNVVTQSFTVPADGATIVSIQLGIPGDEAAGVPASALQGSFIKLKDLEIYDAVNTYHQVNFVSGENVLKSIPVRDGKTVAAPAITAPQGKIFEGWYVGEEPFDPNAPITKDTLVEAVFVDESEVTTYNVTFQFKGQTYTVLKAVEGKPVSTSDVDAPFGYAIDGFFVDAAFTTPYNNEAINEATTLYIKAHVAPTTYYHEGQVAREERVGPNGEFITEYHNNGFTDGWNIQVNFVPPVGDAGKTYVFTAQYSLVGTAATGSYQVYDGGSIVAGDLPPQASLTEIRIEYPGGVLSKNGYLTFELGLCKPELGDDGTVVFTIDNPTVNVKA